MKKLFVVLIAVLASLGAWAQEEGTPKIEVPILFSLANIHPNVTPITSFNLYGGGGQFDVNFGRVFGIKAEFMGYTQGSGLRNQLSSIGYAGQLNGNAFSYMFGPQFKKHSGKVQPFAEVLLGAFHTNAYATIVNAAGGTASVASDNNFFSMAAGGGIDLKVNRHFSIRPVEVDYLMTRFHVNGTGYTSNQNNFRYQAGFLLTAGGAPPASPTASCTVSPNEIMAGEPVTARMTTTNFNPKHDIAYTWASTGPKVGGSTNTASIDTTGLAPGSYSITGKATDSKKSTLAASCNSTFAVKEPPRHPPTAACNANPGTVKAGDLAAITVDASSPDGRPLTYAYTSTGGQISGTGANVNLDTTTATPGTTISTMATVSDDRGLTATCNANVAILAPPVVVKEASEVGECKFMNPKKPWRVDNECKAILDTAALRIQREPDGKLYVVGYEDEEEVVTVRQLGEQRSVNIKKYLTEGEGKAGIDPASVVAVKGKAKSKSGKIYFVPAGATLTVEETESFDETAVNSPTTPVVVKKASKKE